LLIRRAERLGDPWSSHLAFPGGRSDTLDANLEATAQRETREEVGLDLSVCAELLGAGAIRETRTARQAGARMSVAPYVYFCHSPGPVSIEPEEVAEAFWLDILPLLNGSRDTHFELEHSGNKLRFPGYQVGEQVLWGLSYLLLQPLIAPLRSEWLGA
jgi:8-oxo-dGTP pyrophosphatase MutT (NUDIX family)